MKLIKGVLWPVDGVASKEIGIDETSGCKALVLVEDNNTTLPMLAATFLGTLAPNTKAMSVIGVMGAHGKTTSAFL